MRNFTLGFFILTIVTFFSFLGIDTAHAAHKLESQHIHVFINDDGSANITETRIADLSEGTENYIVIENLGKSTIQNFSVTENGQQYEYVDNWNIDASREEKTFKNGIINTSDGYELAWGIGDYGRHEYVLQYTITDFIKQVDDAQMLFWQFVNPGTNIPPENVTVEIEANKQISAGEEGIWAFGYHGDIHIVDGKVIANSSQPLSSDNYVTILVEFNQGVFSTNDILSRTMRDVKEEAFVGSDYDLDEALGTGGASDSSKSGGGSGKEISVNTVFIIVLVIVGLLVFGGIAFVIFIIVVFILSRGTEVKPERFRRKYKDEYYRDYPAESFLYVYYIGYKMGASDFKTVLTALLLRWMKEERIRIEEAEVGTLFKRNQTTIFIQNSDMGSRNLEGELFNMLVRAADKDGALSQSRLSSWAQRNQERLFKWEKRLRNASARYLEKQGQASSRQRRIIFNKVTIFSLTTSGEELEANMYRYINYLHDYSLLHEHDAVNVMIWDEIMVWAGFFGITEEVMKQFKAIYPKYEEESLFREKNVAMATAVATQTNKARSTYASRSSGGGGSASIGGGGGSFGGGSGGGTR